MEEGRQRWALRSCVWLAGKLQMEGEMKGPAGRLAIRAVASLGDAGI